MRFLIDANVPRQIADALIRAGHDVDRSVVLHPGETDASVLARAEADQRIVITQDRDFGELVFRRGQHCRGVLFLRLAGLGNDEKSALVVTVVAHHETQLIGNFAVLERDSLRIRPLPAV